MGLFSYETEKVLARFCSEDTTLILLISIFRISAKALTILTSSFSISKQFKLNLMALLNWLVFICSTVTFSESPKASKALSYKKYSV